MTRIDPQHAHDMDPECVALCDAINSLKGLETYSSCCGHGHQPFRIYFMVESIGFGKFYAESDLVLLLYCLRYAFEKPVGWSCRISTDVTAEKLFFCIESEATGNEAYDQASTIASKLMEFVSSRTRRCFVNVYLVDRAYGGPEEGGWWYECGELKLCVPTTGEYAEVLKSHVEKQYSNEGRRPISSVLSDGEYRVTIDDEPGESWPKQRPHYE